MKEVIFVCTGNTCRSPMAEAVFNHIAKLKKINIVASSCGVFAKKDDEMCPFALAALSSLQIEVPVHKARPMKAEIFKNCVLAVGMTQHHTKMTRKLCESICLSVYNNNEEIEDPFGQDLTVYSDTLKVLYAAIEKMIDDRFLNYTE